MIIFSKKKFQLFSDENLVNNFDCSSKGCILIEWKVDCVSFSLLDKGAQFVHGLVYFDSFSILITYVYMHDEGHDRIYLWNFIFGLASAITSLWLVMEDFITTLSWKDKVNGTPLTLNKLGEIRECVFDSGLLDLKCTDLYYTWSNLQIKNPIFYKIDQMLCNPSWMNYYPSSFYNIVTKLSCDHSSLILSMQSPKKLKHHFLFKFYLMKYLDFIDLVKNVWRKYVYGDPIFIRSKKLQNTKDALKIKSWDIASFNSQLSKAKSNQLTIMN